MVSLCAMIFTLPFSKSMVEIFFTIALISWIIKRFMSYYSAAPRISLVKAFTPVSTELNSPIAVFILMGFLSTVCSVSFSLSLKGFFFKLFEWVMIYFIVAESVNNEKKLNWVLLIMLVSALLMGVDGIFQAVTGTDFLRNYPALGFRIQASFDAF